MQEVDENEYEYLVHYWWKLIEAYRNDFDAVALAEDNGSCWIVRHWICAL